MAERQSLLQELIASRGMVDLETLSAELRVSSSTVRRDVDALVARGLVTRTHGGVIWAGDRQQEVPSAARPYAFDQRMDFQVEAKRRIARAARALVSTGDTVLIDGGTTTFYFAEELIGLSLQMVTNSLPITNLYLNDEHVELVVVGGLLYPRYGVLLGPTAEHMLDAMHPKTLFFSVAGIHEGSLYNQNLLLVSSERRMMQQAQKSVLLIDSSKFGQQALARLCGLDQIDVIVTDAAPADDDAQRIQDAGCELIVAPE